MCWVADLKAYQTAVAPTAALTLSHVGLRSVTWFHLIGRWV